MDVSLVGNKKFLIRQLAHLIIRLLLNLNSAINRVLTHLTIFPDRCVAESRPETQTLTSEAHLNLEAVEWLATPFVYPYHGHQTITVVSGDTLEANIEVTTNCCCQGNKDMNLIKLLLLSR